MTRVCAVYFSFHIASPFNGIKSPILTHTHIHSVLLILYDRFEKDNDRLTIHDVQLDDEGLYICYISENVDGAGQRPLVGGCLIIYGQYKYSHA